MAASHAVTITLSEADRTMLQNWTRRRSTAQVLALRARIVLACDEPGITNREAGARLEVCEMTVSKWRRRFAALGVDGLMDAPRSGAPRTILDDQVEHVIVTMLESVPKNATHFIANCRDATTTLGQPQRFLQWLEQEGEDRRLAGRAGARRAGSRISSPRNNKGQRRPPKLEAVRPAD